MIISGLSQTGKTDGPNTFASVKVCIAAALQSAVQKLGKPWYRRRALRVFRAAPDGYTLVVGIWNTHVANGVTYTLQYDLVKDFAPVLLLADAPLLLLANKAVPANDLNEFIAWLKANSDKASMGTVGAGSPGHLLGLLLQKETGRRGTDNAGHRGRADRGDVCQPGRALAA
jgi:hypothetical protein